MNKLTKNDVVLFLPAWYPNRNDQMGGVFAKNHAIALRREVTVHVLHVSAQKRMDKIFDLVNADDEFLVYYRKPSHKNFFTIIYEGLLYGIAMLFGYIKYRKVHRRPKIFHVHVLTRAAMLPFLLSLFSKIDYYITEHWSRYLPADGGYKGIFRKWLTQLIVKRSKGISTVSLAMKNALIAHQLRSPNFPIISNVVNDEFFDVGPDHSNALFKFIHVSCFDEKSKNILGMLKAFKLLQEQHVPFQLCLIGYGPDFDLIKKGVEELALSEITFTGELTGKALINEYKSADALVLFSNYENQPCVILEAQACGLPVIATNVGGIPELINPQIGVLVEAGDYWSLANKMAKMVKDRRYDSQQIRNYAKLRYTKEVVAQQFIDFYAAR